MHTHHSHSGQFCTHAAGNLDGCVREALRQGFKLFCMTEHIPRYREADIYPGEKESLVELLKLFKDYHRHARKLQRDSSPGLEILVGLETEFIRDIDLEILDLLVAKYPVDFMVGSVHHVNGVPIDFDRATWQRALDETCDGDEERFYCTYFDHQYQVMQRFRPLVIGHFDVILLFAPEDADLFRYFSVVTRMRRNIWFAREYGALFELNSASFRKGWSSAYPSPKVVNLIKELEGNFCVSDDSHGPEQVGLNFHRLQQYIRDMDIGSLGMLRRVPGEQNNRGQAVKVETTTSPELLAEFLAWKPCSTPIAKLLELAGPRENWAIT